MCVYIIVTCKLCIFYRRIDFIALTFLVVYVSIKENIDSKITSLNQVVLIYTSCSNEHNDYRPNLLFLIALFSNEWCLSYTQEKNKAKCVSASYILSFVYTPAYFPVFGRDRWFCIVCNVVKPALLRKARFLQSEYKVGVLYCVSCNYVVVSS